MVRLIMLVRQKPNLEQDLSAHRSFGKKLKVLQQRLQEHYGQHSHYEIDDWQFTLIE